MPEKFTQGPKTAVFKLNKNFDEVVFEIESGIGILVQPFKNGFRISVDLAQITSAVMNAIANQPQVISVPGAPFTPTNNQPYPNGNGGSGSDNSGTGSQPPVNLNGNPTDTGGGNGVPVYSAAPVLTPNGRPLRGQELQVCVDGVQMYQTFYATDPYSIPTGGGGG